jgi:FixJ family two-component response regulator
VLDLAMPGVNGMELQRELAARGSILPVVFLTGHGDVPTSVQAMKRGAADFLTKPVDENDLLAAIRTALEKGSALRRERDELAEVKRRIATLTPREREVLEHIVAGKRNKQVAGELGTVEKTVKVHRARVMGKMQAKSLAELVRLAERAGIRGTLD